MSYATPPDPKSYAAKVYAVVRQIPVGRVMTYGQIAALIPPIGPADSYLKLAPRWVGSAMAQCPEDVPWQRVINAQGKVSARPGYGPLVQKSLLEQENVVFDAKERVDLKRYGWMPEAAWLRANGYVVEEPLPQQSGLF